MLVASSIGAKQPLNAQNTVTRNNTWDNTNWVENNSTNVERYGRIKYLNYYEYSFATVQGKAYEQTLKRTNNGSIIQNYTYQMIVYKIVLTLPQTWTQITNKFTVEYRTEGQINTSINVPLLSNGYYINPTSTSLTNLETFLASENHTELNNLTVTIGVDNDNQYVYNPTNTYTAPNRHATQLGQPMQTYAEMQSYTPSQNNVTLQTNDEIYLIEYLTFDWKNDTELTVKQNALTFAPNTVENNFVWDFTPSGNYEVIDIGGVMLQILAMPWSFISTAFNVTLFPATPYEINVANLAKGILGICAIMFIISLFTKGFSAIGSYVDSGTDRRLQRERLKGQKLTNNQNRIKLDQAEKQSYNIKENGKPYKPKD